MGALALPIDAAILSRMRSPMTSLELREGQQHVEGQAVESECGAVAVGRTYLLPPLR